MESLKFIITTRSLIMKATTQLERDIAFCIDELDLSNEQIGELLRACEKLGNISCEYFAEEFVFCDDKDAIERYHDSDYLKIEWRLNNGNQS